MTRTALALCMLSILALALPTAPAFAETGRDEAAAEEEKAEPQLSPLVRAMGGRDRSSETKVYTNEDLEELVGSGSAADPATTAPSGQAAGTTAAASAASAQTAVDQMFEKEEARQEHEKSIADAEKRIADAKQRVLDLEKRLLAIRNPLLARPAAPEAEEEAAKWNAGNAQDRVSMTETQLQAARDEVAAAESALAALRAGRP